MSDIKTTTPNNPTTATKNASTGTKKEGFQFILIPWEESKPIQTIELQYPEKCDDFGGDQIPTHLKTFLDESIYQIEATPLKRMSPSPPPSPQQQHQQQQHHHSQDTNNLFLQAAGVYAYHCVNSDTDSNYANIRATSLSMACGLLSQRFYGDVFLSRLGYFNTPFSILQQQQHGGNYDHNDVIMMNKSIFLDEIKYAAYVTPDLRKDITSSLLQQQGDGSSTSTSKEEDIDGDKEEQEGEEEKEKEEKSESDNNVAVEEVIDFPNWIVEATKCNYEDAAALSFLAKTMNRQQQNNNNDDDDDDDDDDDEDEDSDSDNEDDGDDNNTKTIVNKKIDIKNKKAIDRAEKKIVEKKTASVVVQTTLCFHCRRPSQYLCPDCEGVYFCEAPRQCKQNGWSHICLCKTWSIYTKRRSELSTFPFTWHSELMSRQCQLADEPYESYLKQTLGVLPLNNIQKYNNDEHEHEHENTALNSWWKTEESGWKGGTSDSAKQVQLFNRRSYKDGFALSEELLPPERNVTSDDCGRVNVCRDPQTNFAELDSWEDYYSLRGIPFDSPVALLCTFPLTLYYAVQEYGKVPIVVSKMLKRPMRIHVVGVEKELNFLDIFKEFGFLLPNDVEVELVFICREDCVPKQCNDDLVRRDEGMKIDLTSNLTLYVQPGTFGDTLNPLFDCGTGPPDMVLAFNAGLYAYESWRSVIQFLNENRGIVGVFTDYNEHSGMHCASLGGGQSRESLKVNPFRQPRAMPVYSMNLPQFCNGFLYAFNEQELDM